MDTKNHKVFPIFFRDFESLWLGCIIFGQTLYSLTGEQ
jgi:hypothetical protein